VLQASVLLQHSDPSSPVGIRVAPHTTLQHLNEFHYTEWPCAIGQVNAGKELVSLQALEGCEKLLKM
jgi:hypothetical protein